MFVVVLGFYCWFGLGADWLFGVGGVCFVLSGFWDLVCSLYLVI